MTDWLYYYTAIYNQYEGYNFPSLCLTLLHIFSVILQNYSFSMKQFYKKITESYVSN